MLSRVEHEKSFIMSRPGLLTLHAGYFHMLFLSFADFVCRLLIFFLKIKKVFQEYLQSV